MTQAKKGDTVKVHYTGTLKDGTQFDTSRDREPLQFTLGEGQIIPGFEKAVIGMNPGDSKSTTIPSEKAYGPRRDDLVLVVERDRFPEHIDPKVGQNLELKQPDDQSVRVTVTETDDSTVTLDANHMLAGKDLTFDIELVEIV